MHTHPSATCVLKTYLHSSKEVRAGDQEFKVSILSGLGQGAGRWCTGGSSWGSLPRTHAHPVFSAAMVGEEVNLGLTHSHTLQS